jgi:hypothetical protein
VNCQGGNDNDFSSAFVHHDLRLEEVSSCFGYRKRPSFFSYFWWLPALFPVSWYVSVIDTIVRSTLLAAVSPGAGSWRKNTLFVAVAVVDHYSYWWWTCRMRAAGSRLEFR